MSLTCMICFSPPDFIFTPNFIFTTTSSLIDIVTSCLTCCLQAQTLILTHFAPQTNFMPH